MKSVARLVWLHFFGAAGLRWLSAAGLISVAVCVCLWRWRPDWLPAILFGFVGIAALFVGTSLMPVVIVRTASGSLCATVPYLRVKLLASALLTVLLVSLPLFILAYAGVGQTNSPSTRHLDPAVLAVVRAANIKLMWAAFLVSANLFTWLYIVAWLVTSRRSPWGLFRALVVLSLILYAPVRQVATPEDSLRLSIAQLCATWTVFAILFLAWPRWQTLGARLLRRFLPAGLARRDAQNPRVIAARTPAAPPRSHASLRATDVVLGTAHPWAMAAALGLPTLLAARISAYFPGAWLYCLVLFATSSAAIAGQASMRSRALWLAGGWSRVELFRRVERSFWQHNFIVLAVLLILMVIVGTHVELAPRLMALGIPLLALGTTLGTYLGLMVTRGMRWSETTLGVGVMLALMAGALMADRADFSRTADVAWLTGLAAALVVSAIILRLLSRRRWERLDWTECRPERVMRARTA
jgi:hypothetical protein